MTDFVWPDDLPPYAMSFYLQPHTGRSISPFTRQQKIYELSAPMWLCRMSFRGGYSGKKKQAAFGARLDAFLAELRGGANRVEIYDFRRPKLRGSNGGWSIGNEAAAAGATTMVATGFGARALAFMPGDYVGGDGRIHIVKESTGLIYADADGEATVSFWPPLSSAVAEDAGVFGNPTSMFRLVDDDAGANGVEVGQLVNFDIALIEDI